LRGVAWSVGGAGVGTGLRWVDSAAALSLSAITLWDGLRNMKGAVLDLMDERATTFDDRRPHPVAGEIQDYLRGLRWVRDAGVRVRDEGHVFQVDAFVVPKFGRTPPLRRLDEARQGCIALDWRVHDILIVPVDELPEMVESARHPERERHEWLSRCCPSAPRGSRRARCRRPPGTCRMAAARGCARAAWHSPRPCPTSAPPSPLRAGGSSSHPGTVTSRGCGCRGRGTIWRH